MPRSRDGRLHLQADPGGRSRDGPGPLGAARLRDSGAPRTGSGGRGPARPPRSAEDDPIDRKVLDGIRSLQRPGAASFLDRIIGLYLGSAAGLLAQLRDAVAAGDASAARIAAHTLKSSSANVGAMRLASLCKDMEALGRSGSLDGAAEKTASIDVEFARARRALESCLQEARG